MIIKNRSLGRLGAVIRTMAPAALLVSAAFPFTIRGASGVTVHSTRTSPSGLIRHFEHKDLRIGQVPLLVEQSAYLGPLDSGEIMDMSISFQVKDERRLLQTMDEIYDPASPRFHQWLSPAEFGLRFGRSPDEIHQAFQWLTAQGFVVNQIWPSSLAITFSGVAEAVQRAFKVSIGRYRSRSDDRVFYSNDREPLLPVDLAALTVELLGLNTASPYAVKEHTALRPSDSLLRRSNRAPLTSQGAAPAARSQNGFLAISPADFQMAYDVKTVFDAGIHGESQRVAIIVASDIGDSDIALYRQTFNLPTANVRRFTLPGRPSPGIVGGNVGIETALDYACVSAFAPGAEIDLVLSPDVTQSNFRAAEQYVVNSLIAPVVSVSISSCEQGGFSVAEQTLMRQAMSEGIAFFVGTGDDGAECIPASSGTPSESGVAMINCPACYDGVTAVGGTSFSALLDPVGNLIVANEVVWNTPPGVRLGCDGQQHGATGATGGGVSALVAMPSYQANARGFSGGVPAVEGRVVPDVSILSFDPFTPVIIGGAQMLIAGGNSQAAPLWAGLMALINQFKGSPQGAPNPELYRLGTSEYRDNGPLTFIDITEGDNSTEPRVTCVPFGVNGAKAVVGFDAASGWGTPDFAQLVHMYGTLPLPVLPSPPPPPTVDSVTARLVGDTLTLFGTCTDVAAAVTQAQVSILDGTGAVVSQFTPFNIQIRHSISAGYQMTLNGMDQLPAALMASVVLIDRFGNRSTSMVGDFSGADPGAPTLTTVSFNGSQLVIEGQALDGGKFKLEVNGSIVAKKKSASGTEAIIDGNQMSLNLQPGIDRIRLKRGSLFSNIFLLRI